MDKCDEEQEILSNIEHATICITDPFQEYLRQSVPFQDADEVGDLQSTRKRKRRVLPKPSAHTVSNN